MGGLCSTSRQHTAHAPASRSNRQTVTASNLGKEEVSMRITPHVQATPELLVSTHQSPEGSKSKVELACYALVSEFVANQDQRHALADLRGDEAQVMADFLNEILEHKGSIVTAERRLVLHTLSGITRAALVFPASHKLSDVHLEEDPFLEENFSDRYKGRWSGQVVDVKVSHVLEASCETNLASDPSNDPKQFLRVCAKDAILRAHMSHPNILPLHGVHVPDNNQEIWSVSPWIEFGSLPEYLRKSPEVPRVPLIMGIISGLLYLHDNDIIHGDLRGQNVLVSKGGRAILTNFDVSHVHMRLNTMSRTAVASEFFMAPELLLGTESGPTRASDIWAFACTYYEVKFVDLRLVTNTSRLEGDDRGFESVNNSKKDDLVPKPEPKMKTDKDEQAWREMKKCWRLHHSQRPAAKQLFDFLSRVYPGNNSTEATDLIARPHHTVEINYPHILSILERMSSAQGPTSGEI
ncbi:hypothetical protein NP233_g9740 [Leucocoprinus birnbaumii]|uniref:Protein kinase domain-containing protein n=1 Tax=Leucocoprinus birnbaumii TaxID=56174 RepID=A0AAD5VJN3_9AGAR|nr:hypothetical protein NP233_g9740 [Leucocoprinus birnbaumii]